MLITKYDAKQLAWKTTVEEQMLKGWLLIMPMWNASKITSDYNCISHIQNGN